MNNRCSLQIALLLCFSTTTLSLSYKLLALQQSNSILKCQELLMQLNGRPEDCLNDTMDFKIPEEIKHPQQFQKEHAAFVTYEMLQNIYALFTRDFSNPGWNETIVKDLLVGLHQQMDLLETTLEEKLGEENVHWGNSILYLKSYYWRILRYLKAKEFSSCAWTVVQSELFRNFSFITRLTDDFQS
ncbi:interferon beta-like [Sciurus carolinensis]|uniref:interferon beta-like n=1 Tax=Sciurus carolinensis TaxID=30640 RepID=UPI001FB42578|nr:interferon beta-like [Sciurus carolinensis]